MLELLELIILLTIWLWNSSFFDIPVTMMVPLITIQFFERHWMIGRLYLIVESIHGVISEINEFFEDDLIIDKRQC